MKWIFIIIGEIYESNMVRCKHKSCQKSRKKTGKERSLFLRKKLCFLQEYNLKYTPCMYAIFFCISKTSLAHDSFVSLLVALPQHFKNKT
jgi:hypothetical protein